MTIVKGVMRLVIIIAVLWSQTASLIAQDDFLYEDHVYLPNVKTVKLHHQGLYTSNPVIDLNSKGKLVLSFDDILGGDITYSYRVIHCDRNWNPTELDFSDYMEGFNDGEIEQWQYSSGTKVDYTHYRLTLPNDDVEWRISGNYLLIVTDEDEGKVAITRRIMVAETKVTVFAETRRAIRANQVRSHQQIELFVNNKNYEIRNPQRDLSVSILQNGNWHNAITDLKPRFVNQDDINFDFTNSLVFIAGRESRFADLRSVKSRGAGIHQIQRGKDRYDLIMQLDESRDYDRYIDYDDLNGDFVIETFDRRDPDTDAEYVHAHFGLVDRAPALDAKVYLTGKFADWQCRPEYEMTYDTTHQGYYADILLKQGYYDYQYVVKRGDKIDRTYYEGSDSRTRNYYLVLVYLRKFGERYDRIIGARSFFSTN